MARSSVSCYPLCAGISSRLRVVSGGRPRANSDFEALAGLGDDRAEAGGVDGADEAGGLDELLERRLAAAAAEPDVRAHGGGGVGFALRLVLQGAGLGQRVVDVVERVEVDVALRLPAAAASRIGQIVPAAPRSGKFNGGGGNGNAPSLFTGCMTT